MRFFFPLLALVLTLSSPVRAAFETGNTSFETGNTSLTFSNPSNQFLPVDQAFQFHSLQQDDQLLVEWNIQDGYYLYQHRLNITGQNVQTKVEIPQGTAYHDDYFGDVSIYTHSPLSIAVNLETLIEPAFVEVTYQGCAKAGFCYPPETRLIALAPITNYQQHKTNAQSNLALPDGSTPKSAQQRLADSLSDNVWSLLLFFVFGIGLAFTPCLFPMYPIITSIILGNRTRSKSKTLALAVTYVQGMAITYSLLGLVVASAGIKFQAALQSPSILISISLVFVLLSCSMFGLYTLQMPTRLQTYMSHLSGQQQGGHFLNVLLMGAISGLICSPCTTAPLSGALLYVSQSGDLLTGAAALYLLSIGMGIPLIIVAVFGQQLLPRSGMWMDKIKVLFGFVLLAAPIYLLERLLPPHLAASLWSLLGITLSIWLYRQVSSLSLPNRLRYGIRLAALLGMAASLLPLQPWLSSLNPVSSIAQTKSANIHFHQVTNLDELEQQLQLAQQHQKPVMLDFYADWCVACKEFEHKTFQDPDVAKTLEQFHLIQADVTHNQAKDFAMLDHLDVLGLPTLIFWDAQGTELDVARVTGFMKAPDFLRHIQQPALQTSKK